MSAIQTENISEMVRLIQKYIGPSVPRIEGEAAIYAAANEIEEWQVAKQDEYTVDIVQGSNLLEITAESFVSTRDEYMANGEFDTDTSSWNAGNAVLSVVSGRLRVAVQTGGSPGEATQQIFPPAGTPMVISGSVFNGTTNGQIVVGTTAGASDLYVGPLGSSVADASFTAGAQTHITLRTTGTVSTEYAEFDDITVHAAQNSKYSLNGIKFLSYRDRPMTPKTEKWIDDNDRYWRDTEEGEPLFYFVERLKETNDKMYVRLSRKPAENLTDGFSYVVTAKSRPTTIQSTDNQILAWYRKYGELLEFGAAGRILMQPGRKWSNATMGQYYLKKFNQMKQELISQSHRSHSQASVSVRQRNWV